MQCQARSKRSRAPCQNHAMRGKRHCRMHGGKTPMGYGLPQMRSGKYSKLLPLQLAQTYEEARSNEDLLSLRDDLAACEARLTDLFARLDQGTAADDATWAEIGRVWHLRCTLTQTEQKRLVAMQQMISTEQLMVLLGVMTDAITHAVTTYADPAVAHAILADLSGEFSRMGLHAHGAEA